MDSERSSEFDGDPDIATLLRGIDEAMPGPSTDFAERLFDELSESIAASDDPPVLSVVGGKDQQLADVAVDRTHTVEQLHDVSRADPDSTGGGRWLIAAAVALIGCVVAGAYFLSTNSGPSVLASDPPTGGTVAEPPVTSEPELEARADEPESVPLDFSTTLGFTEVSTSTIRATFTATDDSVFNATIRSGDDVVSTQSGSAVRGEPVQLTFTALATSTVYSVEVTLLGPPSVVSPRLEIRTGGDTTPIEISQLVQTEQTGTTVGLEFSTNLCARWSAVVLDLTDQTEVQRVNSDPDIGCRQEHHVVLGAEMSLAPRTSYLVLVETVAESAEEGATNLMSELIQIQTEE